MKSIARATLSWSRTATMLWAEKKGTSRTVSRSATRRTPPSKATLRAAKEEEILIHCGELEEVHDVEM